MATSSHRPVVFAVLLGLAPVLAGSLHCGPARPPPPQIASSAPSSPSAAPEAGLTAAEIDREIRAAWQKEGIQAAGGVDDARFLRRLWIDLQGVIPPPERVEAFLADSAPDKRARAIDEALGSPLHAEHWTNYWDRVLLGRQVRVALVDRPAFRGWLKRKFEANTPWDKVVYELVTATGQNRADEGDDAAVNGAVNWLLKYRDTPADLTGATSRVFLGVQIQCAQCHDHKTEKWKEADFKSLTACFLQTRVEVLDRDGNRRRVEIRDTDKVPRQNPRRMAAVNEYLKAPPVALDGTDFSTSPNRRKALGEWLTAPKNPWFARAIVNRMWGHLLGRGFSEPVDDFRDTNPPVMPGLLARLTDDFVQHGHDLKHLLRLIVSTEAYQRATAPAAGDKAPAEARLWARYRMMPMGADELLESLIAATRIDDLLRKDRDEGELDRLRQQARRQFATLFEVDEEEAGDDFDGTIPQALMLLNGRLTNLGSSAVPGSALASVLAASSDDEARIRALYLRTLSRPPSPDEVARWKAFLSEPREVVRSPGPPEPAGKAKGKGNKAQVDPFVKLDRRKGGAGAGDAHRQAFEDLFWALLNSSEFFFNH